MPKLNQIVAVVTGKKSRVDREKTDIYKKVQKPALFEGITRTYRPDTEEGERLPDERKNVQYTVFAALAEFQNVISDLWDATATQDWANTHARADIRVGDKVIVPDVPVTYLMFLEKQLQDLHTFVSHLPTLDPAEKWSWDDTSEVYRSESYGTVKTKKALKNHVKAEATDKHPAQVEVFTEDVRIGEWTVTKFNGSIPASEKTRMLERIRQLQEGVKFAREEANSIEVETKKIAKGLFDFVTK